MRTLRARPEEGASAVEYSFIVAAIAAIVVVTVFAVGRFTAATYDDTCGSFDQVSTITASADCT
jgi:Flp pilus assembly pilin Flp